MKKLLLFILAVTFSLQLESQTWCPPGATWHYTTSSNSAGYYYAGTTEIKFTGTATVKNILCKKLTATRTMVQWTAFSPAQHSTGTITPYYTYENNNVYYIFNPGENRFDTIADFNATIGDHWLTGGCDSVNHPSDPIFNAVKMTVTDTAHVTINSHWLRTLTLTVNMPGGQNDAITATEKIGGYPFLFREPICVYDGAGEGNLTCYQDDNFPLYMYAGNTECFSTVGIKTQSLAGSLISVYPNPAASVITLEFPKNGNYTLNITDAQGQSWPLDLSRINDSKAQVTMDAFKQGIYLLQVVENGKLVGTQKIVKE